MSVASISTSPAERSAQPSLARRRPATTQMLVPAGEGLCTDLANRFRERSSLFGSKAWIAALRATYGFDLRASLVARDGDPVAAMLFADIDDLRGRRLVSLPFSDYLDPLAASDALWRHAVDPVLRLGLPLRLRCLNGSVAIEDDRFASEVVALWHGVNLRGTEAELWDRLKAPARQNVRRAEQHGLKVHLGTRIEDLETFYRLHLSVRKSKYRLFAQPFRFFEELRAAFSEDDLFVLLAYDNAVPVAGTLFLIHGDTLYYKFNASSDLRFRPNDLLVWNGIKVGREHGLARMDFGLSDLAQPGLIRFKEKFATEYREIVELRWTPDDYDDGAAEIAGPMLRKLTRMLTAADVPDELTRSVGDELYRFFA